MSRNKCQAFQGKLSSRSLPDPSPTSRTARHSWPHLFLHIAFETLLPLRNFPEVLSAVPGSTSCGCSRLTPIVRTEPSTPKYAPWCQLQEMPDRDDLLTPWCTCFGSQVPEHEVARGLGSAINAIPGCLEVLFCGLPV